MTLYKQAALHGVLLQQLLRLHHVLSFYYFLLPHLLLSIVFIVDTRFFAVVSLCFGPEDETFGLMTSYTGTLHTRTESPVALQTSQLILQTGCDDCIYFQ
jgi:hypothetical protein